MKKDDHKKKSIVIVSVSVFMLIVIGMSVALSGYTPPTPSVAAPETPKEDTSDLNLKVSPGMTGLYITSNEPAPLAKCTVEINDGYEALVSLPPGAETDIDYERFTKNAERFDPDKYAVEQIVIDRCDGATSRMGIYGVKK